MIETRLLNYFLTIAREQNITRAAEALHLTQPTLSKQIKELEEHLGKQLLIRGKKKVTLTDEGAFLRARAQEMLELMEKTESAFRAEHAITGGDIYLGCGETAAMDMITEVYRKLHDQYPDIHFHTHSGDAETVMERLDKGLIDMGLLLGPIRQDKYEYLNIRQKDTFGLLMRRDCMLAKKEQITLADMKGLPLLFPEQTYSGNQQLEWSGMDYRSLNIVATYNLIYNATFLVEKGIGYALTLANLVNTEGPRSLTFRPVTPEIAVDLYIVTKKYQTFSPAAKLYLDFLKNLNIIFDYLFISSYKPV